MVFHPKFQLFKGHDDLYCFRLTAVNGEILLQSESYTAKHNAINGMRSTLFHASRGNFVKMKSQNNQHYFLIKANNGETLATSEMYMTPANMENGIQAVVRAIKQASAEDLTVNVVQHVNPKFELFRGSDNMMYFRLLARNGEIVLQSEGYPSKPVAKKGILSVRNHAEYKEQYFKREMSSNGMYYFNLVAANNKIIGTSEMYATMVAREAGIRSVVDYADEAAIEDTTISNVIDLEMTQTEMSSTEPVGLPTQVQSGESPVPNPKFQVFEGRDNQFYFHLNASNGEIVLQSEGYVTKVGAQMGVQSVKDHGRNRKNFEVRTSRNGKCYFVLRAFNGLMAGQVIGVSEMYNSKDAAENGMQTVMYNCVEAPVEDVTMGAKVFHHPKFELSQGSNNEYFFKLTAKNGKTLMSSEGYTAKTGAMNGIESVRKNALDVKRFEKRVSGDDQFYFVLKAGNGQVICDSETYTTEVACENAIERVMGLAKNAPVEDKTLMPEMA